jgi:hypothetical protein
MILESGAAIAALTLIYLIFHLIYIKSYASYAVNDEEEPLLGQEPRHTKSNVFLKVCTAVILLFTALSCIAGIIYFSLNLKSEASALLLIDYLILVVWIIVAVIVYKFADYYQVLFTVHIMAIISQSILVGYWILEAIDLKGVILKFNY